jgi:hypothetical protein
MKEGVQVSSCTVDMHPEVRLLEQMVVLLLVFLQNLYTVFENGHINLQFHQQYAGRGYLLLTSLPILVRI